VSNDSCGAPAGGVTITKDKAVKEAIVEGHVLNAGAPVSTGYARLLGTGDEFVAEVPLGEDGGFRFFAAPGDWTLRVLAPGGVRLEQAVSADIGQITKVEFALLSSGGTDFLHGGLPPPIPPGPRTPRCAGPRAR
jgi:hypothetical protein